MKTGKRSSDRSEDFDDGSESDFTPHDPDFGPGNLEAIRLSCEAIGHFMETWGFKRVMGSLWAFLYLCPEPASAKTICDTLGISPALVSITLQELSRWGVVRKLSPLGQRRDYWVAEHDVWKMIKKVLRERELGAIDQVQSHLQAAQVALDSEKATRLEIKGKRTCQFQKVRIDDLLTVTQLSKTLLMGFVDEAQVDISPIFGLLQPSCSPLGEPYNLLAKAPKDN